ncbi:FAD-binding oxidoreductase [Herbiconiux ginsengi]|uniref:FAD/FMN-containing dehydrogenase n=1 Tax=Herbiconiux ginsengi TaxID=381665 RepID=A0A1H3REY5_9MICO|nr:FAD-binding oxidoreductase [Herbiconiux ginsengi]SDZ24196.1 FAD/FMN-containing dehydrogenase [Herbiconiux ginsengi]
MSARDELPGRVVRPGDEEYDTARASWNLLVIREPSAIVFVQAVQDVVDAVGWARRNDVAFRVRSGRHSLEGWSSLDGGLVIDVSELKSVALDPDARTATVGAGLTQLEAVTALGAAGFATPTGTEGSVGLAGATLGGGFGLLTRAFGLASDNLLSVEIVTAAGIGGAEAITVDVTRHADLLWALRGAGNGGFGVVTALTYRIHPVPRAVYLTAHWTGLGDLDRVFEAWQRSAPTADVRLTSQLEIHRDDITMIAVSVRASVGETLGLLQPVLSIGHPEVSAVEGDWAGIYGGFQIPTPEEAANWKFASQFVTTPLPPEAIDVIASFMASAPTSECNYFANAFGGVVPTSEPPGGSVFAHRSALFYAEPGAGWGRRGGVPARDDPLTPECLRWVAAFEDALSPFVQGAYVNVPNAGAAGWQHSYWGSNVERLRQVKAAYDPYDVFRHPQSVSPEPGGDDHRASATP